MIPNINVLYIDDEENNLISFKSGFRRNFKVFTALSGDEGLQILEKHNDIHVIVTDQRMPGTTGVQFLEKVVERFPKPIRVLLTGFSDIEAVIAAINKGQVYKYISKPWNDDEILKVITDAHQIYLSREDNDMFVYKASHDLRGPLASIEGLLEIIKSRVDNQEEIYRYIHLIDTSVIRVQDIMSELIEFKQLGEVMPKHDTIDFKNCIETIKESISFMANFAKNTFDSNINQNISFRNDPLILKSIIQNLISNSVKYGNYENENDPKITIKVDVSETKAILSVSDNGIGMKEEAQKNVFEMFYREGVSNVPGTGLGMFITKKAVEKLGGEIKVESTLGEGSIFTITLPNYTEKKIPNEPVAIAS